MFRYGDMWKENNRNKDEENPVKHTSNTKITPYYIVSFVGGDNMSFFRGFTTTGVILVLFILLVIVSTAIVI
jgi:hypothetical protein